MREALRRPVRAGPSLRRGIGPFFAPCQVSRFAARRFAPPPLALMSLPLVGSRSHTASRPVRRIRAFAGRSRFRPFPTSGNHKHGSPFSERHRATRSPLRGVAPPARFIPSPKPSRRRLRPTSAPPPAIVPAPRQSYRALLLPATRACALASRPALRSASAPTRTAAPHRPRQIQPTFRFATPSRHRNHALSAPSKTMATLPSIDPAP